VAFLENQGIDKAADQNVTELYGLLPEDIAVVEGKK
jgi:hypothetical protein